MATRRAVSLALMVVPLCGSACFYVDPVNRTPVARIDVESDPIYKDQPVLFSAAGSYDPDDPSGRSLSYTWEWAACRSEDDCDPLTTTASGPIWSYPGVTTKNPYLIFLQVADPYGAHDEVRTFVMAENRLPQGLEVQVRDSANAGGPFTLGQSLSAYFAGSDPDGETLMREWSLVAPADSVAQARDWEPGSCDATGCTSYDLRPDVAGAWAVEVRVNDGYLSEPLLARADFLVVADAPPCIAAATPAAREDLAYILERAGGTRRFSVDSVADDLDPYPPVVGSDYGVPQFRWFLSDATTGTLAELVGHDLNDQVLDPAAYVPGDVILLRVEVADRNLAWPACSQSEPTCAAAGETCLQRVTWRVEVR